MEDSSSTRARIFWTGGSQAVRLPKAMRFDGDEVVLKKRGPSVVIEPVPADGSWDALWDRLVPLRTPIRRWPTRRAEKRRDL